MLVLTLKILYVLALMVPELCQGAKEVYKCFSNRKQTKQANTLHTPLESPITSGDYSGCGKNTALEDLFSSCTSLYKFFHRHQVCCTKTSTCKARCSPVKIGLAHSLCFCKWRGLRAGRLPLGNREWSRTSVASSPSLLLGACRNPSA